MSSVEESLIRSNHNKEKKTCLWCWTDQSYSLFDDVTLYEDLEIVNMPYEICLAARLQPRPFHRRHGSLISSITLCSAVRGSPSPDSTALYRQKVLSLIEEYTPRKGQNQRIKSANLPENLEVLHDWGFYFEEVSSCIRAFPNMLYLDSETVQTLLETLISLGFSKDDIRNLVIRYPRMIRTNHLKLLSLFEYFHYLLDTSKEQFVHIIMKRPSTVTLSVKENIIPTCQFCMTHLEMDKEQLARTLRNYPQLLACSLEGKIKPTMQYFVEELGIPRTTFLKRIKYQPQVLGKSLKSIKMRVHWMQTTLGYSEADLRKIFSLSINILQFALPTVQTKIDNLCEKFDLTLPESADFIKVYPQLLTLSVENVNSTLDYITNTMHRDISEVASFPRILWCSLENRIKPRYRFMIEHSIPQKDYSVSTLYATDDKRFERLVLRHLEN